MNITLPPPTQSEAVYKSLLPTIMTTFEMPKVTQSGEKVFVDSNMIVEKMPFASFAIRERFLTTDSQHLADLSQREYRPDLVAEGVETVLLARGIDKIIMVSKMEFDGPLTARMPTKVLYTPYEKETMQEAMSSLTTVNRLYQYLYGRKHRFVEKSVSRQVRRHEGRPSQYREFIVVSRDSPQYADAMRPSEIVKRLRLLHTVHGHDRTYRHQRYVNMQGKTQFIQPFTRGVGDALQVKDYRLKR